MKKKSDAALAAIIAIKESDPAFDLAKYQAAFQEIAERRTLHRDAGAPAPRGRRKA